MKIKFMLLFSAAALALAAGLSNCAKENPLSTPTNPENPAGVRGPCDITIQSFGNLQICGTQTNAAACAPNMVGLENVAAGVHNYTITQPAGLRLTNVGGSNPDRDLLLVEVTSNGQTKEYYIPDGDFQDVFIDDNCDFQ